MKKPNPSKLTGLSGGHLMFFSAPRVSRAVGFWHTSPKHWPVAKENLSWQGGCHWGEAQNITSWWLILPVEKDDSIFFNHPTHWMKRKYITFTKTWMNTQVKLKHHFYKSFHGENQQPPNFQTSASKVPFIAQVRAAAYKPPQAQWTVSKLWQHVATDFWGLIRVSSSCVLSVL